MAGIDPVTALVNLAAVLGAAGASMADLVKTTTFAADVSWSCRTIAVALAPQ